MLPTAYRIHSELGVHTVRCTLWSSSSVSERSTFSYHLVFVLRLIMLAMALGLRGFMMMFSSGHLGPELCVVLVF